ncbi:hypothetical protein AN958_01450 [Leucoagaricus sp. SymC.cos]|nr:hypothetical protein AN958_01450 [Leucoagaricus sp. SymC.cos]
MSLPPARKDVSEHPAKDAVTAPVNKALKDEDVNRKAVDAFRKGRLPTNKQIDSHLRYVHDNSPVDIDQLSPEGRKLISDTRDIINTARLIVQEKNADELLQQFIWHTRDIEKETFRNGDVSEHLHVNRETARADNEQAVRHLRTLFHIVLTNSEARKLLSDFSVIGRDLLSKTAAKAAETIAPDEEALRHVDESGPSDEFITEGGPDTTIRRHPHEDEARVRSGDGDMRPLSDIRAQGHSHARDFAGEGVRAGEEAADRAQGHVEDVRAAESPTREAQAKKTGLMGKMKDMTQNLTDRIPSQHKDKAHEQYDRGRRFLTEEYFPEVMECQKHDDYQQSIRWLLDYIEEYAKHGRNTAGSGGETARGIILNPKVDLVIREVRTLLERFANNTSLDTVIDAFNVLADDSRRDPELRRWFKTVNDYVRRVLLESGFVLEPRCNAEGRELRETGRHFYDDKYRYHFDNLFNSVSAWFNAMSEDPLNKRFGEDWARLTKDLLFDSEGSLKFKPELWNDIRKVILPQVIDKVGYIPIPRIEYTDENLDLVVENLTLQGRNLFPNIIALEAHNFVKFSPYNAISDDNRHRITLTLEQMQADMRDVAFYYRMKSGIAKMTDSGLADVLLGGRGLSSTIVLRSTTRDKSSVFQVEDVHVKVDSLKFSIRDSKHDFLYKTIKPLATGLVKRQIQKAIKDALTTGLEYIDGQLVAVRDRMESAKQTEGESRTDVLKSLFQNKKEEASVKRAEKHSQFKVVSNKRDSILAQGHPAGWVNLTEEREKAAVHGHEWRSEAFDLVEPEHHRGDGQGGSLGIVRNGEAHQIRSTAVTDVQGLPASAEQRYVNDEVGTARGMRLPASPTRAAKASQQPTTNTATATTTSRPAVN